jgi:hypothetical protein
MVAIAASAVIAAQASKGPPAVIARAPDFELVTPELFSANGGMPNAWADFDNDGDLDQFVGFRGRPNRLYRQERGRFTDVAAAVGLADNIETRAAAWGDFDADGHVDLYVGFVDGTPNRLYRNDPSTGSGQGGDGRHFIDVAHQLGLDLVGVSRQVSWIDYDNDGDLDLFIAFRDQSNRLFRHDGERFTDATAESGVGDPRKTVGAVWFDVDMDGDLDLFTANQNGDTNGLYRNDHGRFVDVARAWGVEAPRTSAEFAASDPRSQTSTATVTWISSWPTTARARSTGTIADDASSTSPAPPGSSSTSTRRRRRGATTTTTAGRTCTSPDSSRLKRTIPITCFATLRPAQGRRQARSPTRSRRS